jgi:hypothetical protein
MPRRSRYLIPADTPHRGELTAALAVAALLAHLLFAQLTLALTAAFWVISRISRWRPQWLAVPAVSGLLWALAIGPGRAAAGFAAGPGQVAAYLAGTAGHPGHLLHLSRAFAGLSHWLPRQLPFALIASAAEAAAAWWLSWLHSGEPDLRSCRPGLIVAARRRYTTAALASGGVVTRDGGCIGLDETTGRRAAISWQEAERGVLCAGPDGIALAETGFQLACAAIRRRKAVIAIDLTGSPRVAESAAAVCAAVQAPLSCYGEPGRGWYDPGQESDGPLPAGTGPGCYEPFHVGDPARAASLVMAMIDWTGVSDQHRRTCAGYLTDVFAVIAAAPAGQRLPVLDDAVRLLQPAALRSRAARIPAYHPRRDVLADRADVSASLLEADLAAVSAITAQLPPLRGSALGHWLRPARPARPAAWAGPAASVIGADGATGAGRAEAAAPRGTGAELVIGLGQAVRERAVVLFSLDRSVHGRSASMIARLATADLMAVLADLQGMAARCDSLIWINGCEVLEPRQAAALVRLGSGTGAAVLLTTTSAPAAAGLAAQAEVLMIRGPADPALAECFAGLAGSVPAAGTDGSQQGPAGLTTTAPFRMQDSDRLCAQSLQHRRPDALALLVRGPQQRLQPSCRAVPSAGGPA